MRRKRILLLINKLARGGAETQCVRLAKGLHARGLRVRILTLLPSTAFTDDLADQGIPVVDVSNGNSIYHPRVLGNLVQQFKTYRPDVLVTFLYQSDMVGRFIGRFFDVPVRITSIRNEFFGASGKPSSHWSVKLREWLMRITDRLVHLNTTNSELAATSLIDRQIVPVDRMRVIRNMVDLAPYEPLDSSVRTTGRAQHGVEGDSVFVWVHVARFETQKDQATLLQAFARHLDTNDHVFLWLVGDGSRRMELESLAEELQVSNHVLFAGERSDVSDWLRMADGFVMSSQWEGLPNVLLEAGAARLPVVSTNVGGVRETVSDVMAGYLTEPGSINGLADSMNRVVVQKRENASKLAELCEQNYKYVRDHFGSGDVLDQWETVFRELIEDRVRR